MDGKKYDQILRSSEANIIKKLKFHDNLIGIHILITFQQRQSIILIQEFYLRKRNTCALFIMLYTCVKLYMSSAQNRKMISKQIKS